VTLTDAQRVPLIGRYRRRDGSVMTVSADPLGLVAAVPKAFTAGLIPLGPTRFYMPLSDGTATFALGPDGRAASVNLRFDGIDHVAVRIADA
jgi:hypothetical protein